MEQIETSEPGAQMSFLEHLDELRKRIVRSAIALVVVFLVCFYFSEPIYNFLSAPIRRALNEAARQNIPVAGVNGTEAIRSVATLQEGDTGRYMFDAAANLGSAVIAPGTTVSSTVGRDSVVSSASSRPSLCIRTVPSSRPACAFRSPSTRWPSANQVQTNV